MNGITDNTAALLEKIAELECLKPYLLVGGTALALQIATRESEDLDFMNWRGPRNEKRNVDWPYIKKELESIGKVEKVEILDFNHVEFLVNGVKILFYANPNRSPVKEEIPFKGNIRLADKISIGAMKMEVLLRRSKFRDYYDIYSLIEAGENLSEMIDIALKYSGHKLKSKNLIAMLTNSARFERDATFETLNPLYPVNPNDIELKIRQTLG